MIQKIHTPTTLRDGFDWYDPESCTFTPVGWLAHQSGLTRAYLAPNDEWDFGTIARAICGELGHQFVPALARLHFWPDTYGDVTATERLAVFCQNHSIEMLK